MSGQKMKEEVRVSICVATYKRPDSLSRLLDSLENQSINFICPVIWEVVLVDNDPGGSAQAVYKLYSERNKLQLRYVHEIRKGISSARNAAIETVVNSADFLCFIDDDETADQNWLNELLIVQKKSGAGCIRGSVVYDLPPETPLWVSQGGFFRSVIQRDEKPAKSYSTNNVLISCAFLKKTGLRFDERFNQTGGGDEFFFYQARKSFGLKILGAERARTVEHVPAQRVTLQWLIKRRFRVGIGLMRCEILGRQGVLPILSRLTKGVIRIIFGLGLLIVGLVAGRHVMARGAYMFFYGIGVIVGLFGVTYSEYAEKPRISF